MEDAPGPRTLGDVFASVAASSAIMALGFVVVIIGSIGPWVTTAFGSASGFSGDGKITAALAAAGIAVLVWGSGKAAALAMVAALLDLALGIYEYEHLHSALGHAVVFGVRIGTVGWGVYAVIVGAVIAGGGAVFSYTEA